MNDEKGNKVTKNEIMKNADETMKKILMDYKEIKRYPKQNYINSEEDIENQDYDEDER